MTNINFAPKDFQIILSSGKIWERYYENQVFYKKAVLKHFAIFTGRHLCLSIFLIKFIKKELQHTGFSFDYCKIFKSIFREIKRFSIL